MIITKRFKTNFTEEELKNALFAKKDQAEEILNDTNKWEKFKVKYETFLHKAYDIPVLGTLILNGHRLEDWMLLRQLLQQNRPKFY